MARTAERLVVVNTALIDADEEESKQMIEHFAQCVQRSFPTFHF